MAEKLQQLKKKGGGSGALTETTLWTNLSPTSVFSGQTITLTESILNYDYIKIVYRGYLEDNATSEVIYPTDYYKLFRAASETYQGAMHYRRNAGQGSKWYVRGFYCSSTDTDKMVFVDAFSYSVTVGGTTANVTSYDVPLQIIGIK